jgi:predicted anti-sigma-YlaC factor YlaD
MTCRDVTAFLADYVAAELAPDVLARFEAHLKRCANCRAYLAQYQITVAASRQTTDTSAEIPDDLVRAIMASIRTS